MLISEIQSWKILQMDTSDIIALIAVIVSLVAIVLSILAMKQTTNINKTNLQAEYFKKIFFEYIVDFIPEKAMKLRYTNGKLDENYRDLIEVVMEMFQNSKFFSYAKQDFYMDLKKECEVFEDVVLEIAGRRTYVIEEQKNNLVNINTELQKIVELINKNYYKF